MGGGTVGGAGLAVDGRLTGNQKDGRSVLNERQIAGGQAGMKVETRY